MPKKTKATQKLKFRAVFFPLKSEQFYWIGLPFLLIVIVSLGVFIATSFYSVDLASAEAFEKGMQYESVKYWTQFYSVLGNTELLVVLFLMIMILVETFFKFKANKKPSSRWYRGREPSLLTIYGVFLLIWVALNTFQAVHFNTQDKGFGPGFDNEIMDSFKYKQVGKIIAIICQTALLCFGIYWVHFVMVKKPDFWYQEYWVDAIKALFFFALSYVVIAILKWMFGRVYYYNIEFGTLFDQLKTGKDDIYQKAYDTYLEYQQEGSKWKWGFYDATIGGWTANAPDGDYPWWKLNGFFVRPKDSPQFLLPVNYAFPSGHINATFCAGGVFYLLLGRTRKRSYGWKMKTFTVIFLVHLLAMNFAVVVMRWHWFSDTSLTNIWAIFCYFFVVWAVERLRALILKKYKLTDVATYGDRKFKL